MEKIIKDIGKELGLLESSHVANDLQGEILFREAIEKSIPSGISVADETGKQVYVNKAFCNLVGFEDHELLYKKPPYLYWPAEEVDRINIAFEQTLNGNAPKGGFDLVFSNKSGKLIPVQVIISPFSLGYGKTYWLANVIDISSRKEAEMLQRKNTAIANENDRIKYLNNKLHTIAQSLRENEERYRILVENAPEALVVMDVVTQKFVSVSKSAMSLFEMTEDELLRVGVSEISPAFQPDGRLSVDAAVENIRLAIAGYKPAFEWTHSTKQGKLISCEVRLVRLPSESKTLIRGSISDISERKKAEEEVKRSTDRYRGLLNNLDTGIVVHAPDTSITDINPKAELLLGVSMEQIKGQRAIDKEWRFLAADSTRLPFERYPVNQILRTKQPIKNIVSGVYRPSTNDSVWLMVNGFPTFNKVGEITEIVISFNDITERKIAEDALYESEQKYRDLVEHSAVGVFKSKASGEILYANRACLKILDYYSLEDLTPNGSAIIYKDPEQRKMLMAKLQGGGHLDDFEASFYTRTGNERIASLSMVIKDGLIEGTIIDITERKLAENALRYSEEKYRAIFENIQDVFYQIGQDGNFQEISPSIMHLLGYSREEILGRSSLLLYNNPNDRDVLYNVLKEKKELWDYELELKSKTGGIKNVSINAQIAYDNHGKIHHIDGAIRDLSERKKSELKIANQNKELEQFTYIASHDLREPLNTLISVSDLLRDEFKGSISEDADRYINFIVQSSGRMQDLVKGLLEYSRIGKEQELTEVDCNRVIQEVIADMAASIKEKNARISLADLPVLNAHSTELRLLFQNLISNALKFSRKEIVPEINISATKQPGGWLLSVQDNGIGIEPDYRDKIFVIFHRLHSRKQYAGNGIGLAHCKKIVELHGGKIWVDSNAGGGSTFNFTMPQIQLE